MVHNLLKRGAKLLRKTVLGAEHKVRGTSAPAGVASEALRREFTLEQGMPGHGAWQPLPTAGILQGRSGLPLPRKASLETPAIFVQPEQRVHLTFASGQAGTGVSLCLQHRLGDAAAPWITLCASSIPSGPPFSFQRLELSLDALAANACEFRVLRTDESGAECFVSDFKVCHPWRLARLNALSDYAIRIRNEVQHFSGAAYTHVMYGEQVPPKDSQASVTAATVGTAISRDSARLMAARGRDLLAEFAPEPGEVAFNYAMRALGALLPLTPPDFFDRAARLSARRPLRMLSICAGAARVEEQILDRCSGPVSVTLLDASPDLIGRAAQRLASARPGRAVECLVGDVNQGLPGEGKYDVIVCVSALHHVADLERVLGQVNERLADDGEFWSIGEQIGRNGNRLWPDALEAANAAFSPLPPRLRRNAHTGETDSTLSDKDFSAGCFEGIRSEELEEFLERYMVPVDVYKRNAFLWRMVDATYSDNFDLSSEDDLAHLRELVVAEATHWACGGRSTELHGVYRKKTLRPHTDVGSAT